MKMKARPRVAKELEDAFHYFNSKRAGLGNEFLDAYRDALVQILDFPTAWGLMPDNQHRRCRLDRFPYGVIYRIDSAHQLIVVTQVFQLNQNPSKWRRK